MKKIEPPKSGYLVTTTLKLAGKPLVIDRRPAVIQRVVAFLEKSPSDTLYDSAELAKEIGCGRASVQDGGGFLKEYSCAIGASVGGRRNVYGSKKAIESLRRQLAGEL